MAVLIGILWCLLFSIRMPSNQRRAALIRWDKCKDRRAATQAMRDGIIASLRDQVLKENPGLTDEAEIQNRIERKLKIKYELMRENSKKKRAANAEARKQAAADAMADAILDAGSVSGSDERHGLSQTTDQTTDSGEAA